MKNVGQRARFRDLLSRQGAGIVEVRLTQEAMMDSLQSAYEDFLKLSLATLRLAHRNAEETILSLKEDSSPRLQNLHFRYVSLQRQWRHYAMCWDYWNLPWWKRLLRRAP